ncbi:hypothetical protein BDI4_970030 [Burkholderia diffusa]|nr:hypothetical protein BDI4_970030 [Burkholderia diffusa]
MARLNVHANKPILIFVCHIPNPFEGFRDVMGNPTTQHRDQTDDKAACYHDGANPSGENSTAVPHTCSRSR